MSVLDYGKEACGRVIPALDDYLAGELQGDVRAGVEAHLEICESCCAELAARRQILARLRNAVENEPVPASLRASIEEQIGAADQGSRSLFTGPRLAWGALALMTAFVGWTVTTQRTGISPAGHLTASYEIWTLLQEVSEVTGLGLGDHIFCAAFRNLDGGDAVMPGKALMEIGDDQAGLMEAVREVVPEHLTLRIAHRCEHRGREYVHFALMDGDELISVLATPKGEGESIAAAIETDEAGPYQTAVFEQAADWTFVISNLGAEQNLQIAQALQTALAVPQG